MKKILICALLALSCFTACDGRSTSRISDIASESVSAVLSRLEKEVDQGNLAIRKCDRAYAKARQSLGTLISQREVAKEGMARYSDMMQEARAAGRHREYASYKQQYDFCEKNAVRLDPIIEKRVERLKKITEVRKQTTLDVRLLKERMDFLKSMSSAMDNSEMDAALNDAAELVENMRKSCSELSAEVDVLELEDDM